VIERTLAKRYAAAMISVAIKENIVADVESDLLALRKAYEGDATFRMALGQPRIPKAGRKSLLRKPFEGRANKAFLDFLDLLVEKQRVNLIPEIAEMFDLLADATQGVVRVKVSSAFALTPPQRVALDDKLVRITGKKILLEESVDRRHRGGMSVRIGDSVLDGTATGRLKKLKEYLYELQRT
jgi:F-type H+-transporting ATPase subunit delta